MEIEQNQDQQVTVSIIILTWNSEQQIGACLASLDRGLSEFPSEVIVIDNGSQDQTCAVIRKVRPDAQLLCNLENRGVAPARNQGIQLARGEYALILDDDTVVQPGALDVLIRYMEAHPEAGLCGPRLTDADGNLQLSCRRFPTLIDKLARRLPSILGQEIARKAEMADWDHRTIREVDYVIGACQVIRRRALQEVGLLDERIFYGPEDVDICLRLQQAGWQVVYNPDAVVVHEERRVSRSLGSGLVWKHIY
ncbi:MAG: glycosyltransferase family 2 protein, partial [Gammaproteobacteria bacterium]|nr:glycosyltransferase family 2 protein [Gammaproteobacteria bacterium]